MFANRASSFVIALACSAPALVAHASNLSQDWSDSQNPNGPWSYRVGTTLLPHSDSWTAGTAFPVAQPTYQPANVNGNFLPAWYKSTSVPAAFDSQIGDVIVHTNDNSNGNEALGTANVLYTAPNEGTYRISGSLWNAATVLVCCDFAPRPQNWQLLVNSVVATSGTLSAIPGQFTRAKPQTFALLSVPLAAGDTVQLNIFRNANSQAGFFVGTDLTIQAVPELPTSALLLFGAAFLAARSRGLYRPSKFTFLSQ